MKIKEVSAKSILDSRGEKTISVSIKTNVGKFSASSPSGKSKGKYEAKSYKKNLEGDIKKIKQLEEYFSEEVIENFEDLKRVEDIVDRQIGANTFFALESAILKAIAKEKFATSHSSAKDDEQKKQKKDNDFILPEPAPPTFSSGGSISSDLMQGIGSHRPINIHIKPYNDAINNAQERAINEGISRNEFNKLLDEVILEVFDEIAEEIVNGETGICNQGLG